MSEGGLYEGLVLEHGKRPHNRRVLESASHRAHGDNPLCGDTIDLYLRIEHDVIRDVGFAGVACAIATASASLMSDALMGRDTASARRLIDGMRALLAAPVAGAPPDPLLGALGALGRVRDFPARISCATLPWLALAAALDVPAPCGGD